MPVFFWLWCTVLDTLFGFETFFALLDLLVLEPPLEPPLDPRAWTTLCISARIKTKANLFIIYTTWTTAFYTGIFNRFLFFKFFKNFLTSSSKYLATARVDNLRQTQGWIFNICSRVSYPVGFVATAWTHWLIYFDSTYAFAKYARPNMCTNSSATVWPAGQPTDAIALCSPDCQEHLLHLGQNAAFCSACLACVGPKLTDKLIRVYKATKCLMGTDMPKKPRARCVTLLKGKLIWIFNWPN